MSKQVNAFEPVEIPEINKSMIANRKSERAATSFADGLRMIPFDSIRVRSGFNLRDEEDFVPEELESLANSIEAEDLNDPLEVDLLSDGTAIVTDGERRFRSIGILRKRSKVLHKRFESVKCLLNAKEMTDTDRLVSMLTTQSSRPFTQMQEAEGYRRLRSGYLGSAPMAVTVIAVRVGKSVAHVESRLILADAPEEERVLLKQNALSSTAYQELHRQEPNVEKRISRIKEANSKNKKLKVRDVKTTPAKDLCDKMVDDVNKFMLEKGCGDGELYNFLLDIQSQARAIKSLI